MCVVYVGREGDWVKHTWYTKHKNVETNGLFTHALNVFLEEKFSEHSEAICRLFQGVCSVAAALQWWVPCDGGLLWCSAICFFSFPISARPYLTVTTRGEKVVNRSPSGVVSPVLMSQSDWALLSLGVLCGLRRHPNLTRLSCLSGVVFGACCFPFQPVGVVVVFLFFFLVVAS